jgi:hypothetical protein
LKHFAHPRIVDFDAWIAERADGDGQSNPLQEWEVDVDIEPLRLEAARSVMAWNV